MSNYSCCVASRGRGGAIYEPTPIGPHPVYTNWAGNVSFPAGSYYEPENEQEIQRLIKLAFERKIGIRVIGAGHSWNESLKIQSTDLLISTNKLNKFIKWDEKLQNLTVEPGVSIADTVRFYKLHHFTLPYQVDCPDITIGGAVALGASGFATKYSGYAESIVGLELIDGTGVKKVLRKTSTPTDEWNAAIVSVGLLGVITQITLHLVPLTNVEIVDEIVTLSTNPLQHLEQLVAENEGLQFHWFPTTEKVMIHKVNSTTKPESKKAIAGSILNDFAATILSKVGNVYANQIDQHPEYTSAVLNAAVKALPPKVSYVIPACDDILFTSEQHPFIDIGVFVRGTVDDLSVGRKAWDDAIALVNHYKSKGLFPVNFVMAFRVLPANTSLLQTPESIAGAPTSTHRRIHIQIISFRQDIVWKQFSEEMLRIWFSYEGTTPHWAKQLDGYNWLYPTIQATLGKNLTTFLKVRAQYDPNQVFLNDFWSNVLNIPKKRIGTSIHPLGQNSNDPRIFTQEQEKQYDLTATPGQSPNVSTWRSLLTLILLPFTLLLSWSPLLSQIVEFFITFFHRLAWRLAITSPPQYPRVITVDGNLGVKSCPKPNVIDFYTADGLRLQLLHFQKQGTQTASSSSASPVSPPDRDSMVVVMHGLTTSSDMFIMPEHVGFVEFFLNKGYNDVFTVDNRISKRWYHNLEGHNFTLDHLIAYDNVAMLEALNAFSKKQYGRVKGIHIIAHCVNSMSIVCTAAAGLIQPHHQVRSIIINSTGLTPSVGIWARLKLYISPPIANQLFSYFSPKFIREELWTIRKVLAHVVSLFHWECEVPECHLVTFMWSIASKSVWEHSQLSPITHQRSGDLYGGTSLRYDFHIRKCLKAGRMVKYSNEPDYFPNLPFDYLKSALQGNLNTPLFMVTGRKNGVFYDSNIRLFDTLEAARKSGTNFITSPYEKHVFETYGHQDPFMGNHVHIDIFPKFLEFMQKHEVSTPQQLSKPAVQEEKTQA